MNFTVNQNVTCDLMIYSSYFIYFNTSFTCESPYLGKTTAAARAVLPILTSVYSIFVCPNNGIAANAWDLHFAHRC